LESGLARRECYAVAANPSSGIGRLRNRVATCASTDHDVGAGRPVLEGEFIDKPLHLAPTKTTCGFCLDIAGGRRRSRNPTDSSPN